MVVPEVTGDLDPVALETGLMRLWNKEGTFAAQVNNRRNGKPFIFLEGPPTANGRPGIHHVVARTFKDLVCRWKAMQGYLVERKGGWDTHGLPVEIEVQKRLDLMSNDAIEEFGMAEFNEECRNSVWTYEQAWREMTERMAFWVDLEDPYITLNNNYVESCWWALKQMFEKNLLYRGHKVLPFCPQTGTSYSSHEVALGYKEVEEPSVYVKFKLVDQAASILAWTTTPWTLPGNVGLAVGPNVTYVRVRVDSSSGDSWDGRGGANVGDELIVAKDLLKDVIRNQVSIIDEFSGDDLVGLAYQPLFPDAVDRGESTTAWTILSADWVTTTDGTGVVHTAVMYGEDDYNLGMEVGLPAQHTVDIEGRFIEGTHQQLDGKYVKDCDDSIIEILCSENLLYREKMYSHDYPHCWRTEHPLLYYAMDSWFVRMTAVKERLIEFNNQVEWAPDWVGEKRFGDWLSNVKDWAISRERYWGTPLPVWCTVSGEMKCIGSIAELQAEVAKAVKAGLANPPCPDDVDLHRPVVDQFTLVSDSGEPMKRDPFVMDCWFDSGCASFAQWHHPFGGIEKFAENFPIDYICEGVDQTRGWFYTLLAVSTAVFDSICYKSCLSLGHILDKDGKKMSKSRGNVVDPWDHFNREGADASRWYMVSSGSPWNPLKFDPDGVRESYGKMFLTLWNVHRFHADYAALDGFDPTDYALDYSKRSLLDQWIISRIDTLVSSVQDLFESWDFHKACREIEYFVVNDLSNWYVRRSRRRLWDEADSTDKTNCQLTLHEVLVAVSQLIAPIAPFIVDKIYRNLTGESVHLSDWPIPTGAKNPELEQAMDLVRRLAEAGRRVRIDVERRQRLPCREGWIVGGIDVSDFHEILAEEINVELMSTETDLDRFQRIEIVPENKSLGRKCRADLPMVKAAIEAADPEDLWGQISANCADIGGYLITTEDVNIRRVEKVGFAATTIKIGEGEDEQDVSLVLDISITPELISKGLAREIIRRVQARRKELDLDIESKITLTLWLPADAPELFETDWLHICAETRSLSGDLIRDVPVIDVASFNIDGVDVGFKIE